jgi:hypothetical protein
MLALGESTPAPRWLVPETEEDDTAEIPTAVKAPESPTPEPIHDQTFDDQWQDRPSVKDQMALFPDTVRVRTKRSVVYNLSDKDELREWNEVLDRAEEGAVMITDRDRQFFEGCYHMYALIIYYQFKKLVPKAKKDRP